MKTAAVKIRCCDMACWSNGSGFQVFLFEDMGSDPIQAATVYWCSGNIADCLSDVMGSIPV